MISLPSMYTTSVLAPQVPLESSEIGPSFFVSNVYCLRSMVPATEKSWDASYNGDGVTALQSFLAPSMKEGDDTYARMLL